MHILVGKIGVGEEVKQESRDALLLFIYHLVIFIYFMSFYLKTYVRYHVSLVTTTWLQIDVMFFFTLKIANKLV